MSNWLPWNWGKSNDDPVKNLDPTLQDYLNQERTQARKPHPSNHQSSTFRDQLGLKAAEQESTQHRDNGRSSNASSPNEKLPSESLFQDGRYKHLWASYKPLEQLEEAGKSDSNKLMDIVEGYKERQASVGRAAMENCAMEEFALHDCYRRGTWTQIMKMCRDESKALDRCISMQSRFLRALGYSDIFERTKEESEKIQMHADQLYNRMLDHEKIVQEAKAQGKDPPPAEPLFRGYKVPAGPQGSGDMPQMPRVGSVSWDKLEEEKKAKIEATKFANMTAHQKELTKAELDTQLAVIEEVNKRLNDNLWEEYQKRKDRQDRGVERPQDKIRRWFDFNTYPEINPNERLKQTKAEALNDQSPEK